MNSAAANRKTFSKMDQGRLADSFILLFHTGLLSVLTSILFYMHTLNLPDSYMSDLATHISYAMTQDNYSVLFALMKWLYTHAKYPNYSIALLEGVTVGFAFLAATIMIEKLYSHSRRVSMFISLGLLFLTHIYVPVLFPRYYNGSIISQPWHNITYSAMRPFAVLTMLFFAYLHRIYQEEKRIDWKYWILTCLCLVFSAMIKPNFLMGFAPGLLVLLLIDFFGKRNTFKNEFLLGCVVLPAIAILPIQAGLLFDNENGLVFGPSIFFFSEGIVTLIMKFVTALVFPVMVYVYNRHRLNQGAGVAAWGFVFAVLQAMFIMESGMRQTHGNFLWGALIMGYILFIYAVSMFVRDFREITSGRKERTALTTAYLIVGFVLMGLHLFTGLHYFILLCRGVFYYI